MDSLTILYLTSFIFTTRGPRYLEVDVDVGSSQTAARVVGLVQGALKSLVIDIAVLLEGKTQVTSCGSPWRCKQTLQVQKAASSVRPACDIRRVLTNSFLQEELPESLLGTIRLEHLDLSKAATLDTSTGLVKKQV